MNFFLLNKFVLFFENFNVLLVVDYKKLASFIQVEKIYILKALTRVVKILIVTITMVIQQQRLSILVCFKLVIHARVNKTVPFKINM